MKKKEAPKNVLRVLLFVLERFGGHELANHAAAGAYSFLLSATPAFLLVLGIARAVLSRYPRALASVAAFARDLLGPLQALPIADSFFSRPLGIGAAVLAALSLVWAARLFVVAVQRGLRVIWAASAQARPVRESLLTFAIELLCLVAAALILGAAQTARVFLERAAPLIGSSVASILRAVLGAAPAAILLVFAYASLRLIPPSRPRRRTALLSAALCLLLYTAFAAVLRLVLDRARYDLLYGVFGNLVLLLLNVYFFFMIYFYCAELAYVLERFDALLFARFFKVSQSEQKGRIARALFEKPERLITLFGREYAAGEAVFKEGEASKEAYYLLSGRLGVYIDDGSGERRIGFIEEGELFGEMAELLGETRTATTRAEDDSLAIALPPEVFHELLDSDLGLSRRMIALLSERLRRANRRALGEEPAIE